MIFREATLQDKPQLSFVRLAVKENVLNNAALVTDEHYVQYLTVRGKGWVCEMDDRIVGFSIGDLQDNNVWALFILPGYEGRGIGQQLLTLLVNWYFSNTSTTLWLGTAPGTRAEKFYHRFGFTIADEPFKGELRFELTADDWKRING